jgi:prevent-host-death family protein
MYVWDVDVAVTELRAHLSEWIERARGGEEVVITERGSPVARLVGVGAGTVLDRLAAEGVIAPPGRPDRPRASGRPRPRSAGSLSEAVSEQRH